LSAADKFSAIELTEIRRELPLVAGNASGLWFFLPVKTPAKAL